VPGDPPLVSIGLPLYNEETFLVAALDSLLAQDYPALEIVISDNASTDGTQDICLAYAARDTRISYHRENTNTGVIENFNRAFRLSRGQYFMWASGHDTRDPSLISKCVQAIERDRNMILCFPRTLVTEYGGQSRNLVDDKLETVGFPTWARLRTTIHDSGACNAMYGVIRSSALARTRLLRKCFGADHVLLAELSLEGAFHQLEEPLFFRQDNRPVQNTDVHVARNLAVLGSSSAITRWHPRWVMGLEHVRGVWHGAHPLRSKVILSVRAAGWFWGRWRDYLVEELHTSRSRRRSSAALQ
jgi:glycosyltransferase involved in cell wall biosynthesis